MPPLKRGHRHIAGKDSVNQELSGVEKHQERSAVLRFRRKASRTFSSSWASQTSIAGKDTTNQELHCAEKRQGRSAVLWFHELLLLAKIQSIVNWAELRISPAKIQEIEDWG
jgi:hypothetical protein